MRGSRMDEEIRHCLIRIAFFAIAEELKSVAGQLTDEEEVQVLLHMLSDDCELPHAVKLEFVLDSVWGQLDKLLKEMKHETAPDKTGASKCFPASCIKQSWENN